MSLEKRLYEVSFCTVIPRNLTVAIYHGQDGEMNEKVQKSEGSKVSDGKKNRQEEPSPAGRSRPGGRRALAPESHEAAADCRA